MPLSSESQAEVATLAFAWSARPSFSFHLLVVHPGVSFDEVVDALRGVASGRAVVPVAPDAEPLFHASARGTIDALARRQAATFAGDRVCVVDATRAEPDEGDRWAEYFLLLNARRDAVARQLAGPLVVALQPVLQQIFARAASDLWSVRSTSFELRPPTSPPADLADLPSLVAAPGLERAVVPVRELLWSLGRMSEFVGARPPPTPARTVEAIRDAFEGGAVTAGGLDAMLAELDARWPSLPDEDVAARGALAELAVRVARRRVLPASPAVEPQLSLARWLVLAGDVARDLGDFAAARSGYDEARTLLDGLAAPNTAVRARLDREPEAWRYDEQRALTCNRLAELAARRGDLAEALDHAEIALSLRSAVRDAAQVPSTAVALARSHLRVGDLLDRRGDGARAMAQYGRAAALALTLGVTPASAAAHARVFVGALLRLAAARTRAGVRDEAPAALALVSAFLEEAVRGEEGPWATECGVARLLGALALQATDPAAAAAKARGAEAMLKVAADRRPTDLHVARAVALSAALLRDSP